MRMEKTDTGFLKILLTGDDLAKFSLSFDTHDYRDSHTKDVLRRLIHDASSEVGFVPGEHMLIEALPVDDGCLLLVTPGKPTRRLRLKRAGGPFVYHIDSADLLLQLGQSLARLHPTAAFWGSSSLYTFAKGYRLIVYPGKTLSAPLNYLLLSLCERIGEGDAAAAFAAEHGTPLAIGNAREKLCAAYRA